MFVGATSDNNWPLVIKCNPALGPVNVAVLDVHMCYTMALAVYGILKSMCTAVFSNELLMLKTHFLSQ